MGGELKGGGDIFEIVCMLHAYTYSMHVTMKVSIDNTCQGRN